ncbi:hypothetical protein DMUE_4434 [Dictyocoela muelleri]|nr:hypothetical protein DMUE_4434 [Dictyocoela muelleri]
MLNNNSSFNSSINKFTENSKTSKFNVKSLSTFHRDILWLAPQSEHNILNSIEVKNSSHNFKIEHQNINMTVPNTDIVTQVVFEIIEYPQVQNTNYWAMKLKEVIKCNSWAKNTAMSVIKILTKGEARLSIENFSDPIKAIDFLLRKTYNANYAEKLEIMIQNIKQHNFRKITEYHDALKTNIEELQKCNNWTDEQRHFYLVTKFKEGLSQKTRIALKKVRVNTMEDIINYIDDFETQILISYE